MKKLLIVFGHQAAPVKPQFVPSRVVDNAEASGANGRKTDAIGY